MDWRTWDNSIFLYPWDKKQLSALTDRLRGEAKCPPINVSPSLDVCSDGPTYSPVQHTTPATYTLVHPRTVLYSKRSKIIWQISPQPAIGTLVYTWKHWINKTLFFVRIPSTSICPLSVLRSFSYRVQVKWTQVKGFPDMMAVRLVGKVVSVRA